MRTITRLCAILTVLSAGAFNFNAAGQKSITSTSNPVISDFTGYTASGFDPNPGSGQLDSDAWSATGFSDGSVLFGGSNSSGDFARGSSNGGETTGGIYSFDNGSTGEMLGVQPTGSDFTSGDLRMKVLNNTGDTIYGLDIAYSVWTYNDAGRSNSIDLAYSMDNSSYTTLSTLTVESVEAAAGSPSWKDYSRDSTITGFKLSPGDSIYLRWKGDDVSGSGSRDEFGIDDISVQGMGSVDAGFAIAPGDTVCKGSFMDFQDSSNVQNDSIVSYAWDFGNGDTAMGDTVTYSYSDSGAFNVKLVVTTQSGAMDSVTHTILSDTLDDASFHYDTTSFCSADSDPTPTVTGDAGGVFSEGTGGLSIDSSTGTIDLSASSAGDYTVFYETKGDCPDASTFKVEVVDQYDATIDSLGPLCSANDSVFDLVAPHEGGNWSGTGVVNDSTGGFNPNVAGVDTHQVIHDIPGSCGDADTFDIVVDSAFDATIDSVGKYCLPSVTDILSASDGGGVWSGPGIIDSSAGEFSPNDAGVGTHTIHYEIKGGCPAEDSIDIEVDSSKDASIDPLGSYCMKHDTVDMSAADTGGVWYGAGVVDSVDGKFLPDSAGPGSHTIVYEIKGECGGIDSETVTIFDSPDGKIDSAGPYCVLEPKDTLSAVDTAGDQWSGPGIIDAAEGVFDPNNAGAGLHQIIHSFPSDSCGIDDTLMIRVYGVPNASIDSIDTLCANGKPVQLTAADTGGTWSGPGITDSINGEFSPKVVGIGTYTVHYEVQRMGACMDQDSAVISVIDTPNAGFTYSKNGLTVSFTDTSKGTTGYYWEFGDGASDNVKSPTHDYPQDSIYTACQFVYDTNSCSDTVCKTIDLRDVSIRKRKEVEGGLSLRPNPASERVELRFTNEVLEADIRSIELLDLQGRKLRKESFDGKRTFSWRVAELAAGTYFIRVLTDENAWERKFLVK